MTDYGPHLLGRVPRVPDSRDYHMADALAKSNPTELDLALAAVQRSTLTTKVVKRWAKLVTAALEASPTPSPTPPTPTPTPTPDPTPTPTPVPVANKPWTDAEQLDQGQTGHCVGFGWAQWGNTLPVDDHFTNDDGHAIYYECKVIDGEPGAEDGSDVSSGAKAMKNRKRIDAYVFATSMTDIQTWVSTRGPVVVGTNWYNDMFNPDAEGLVNPTGGVAGGHCYILVGYDAASDTLLFQNSWGKDWGVNGYFKMTGTHFAQLMGEQGDACAGLELA